MSSMIDTKDSPQVSVGDLRLFETLTGKELAVLYETARQEGLWRIAGRDLETVDWWTFLDFARLSPLFLAGYAPDGTPAGFAWLNTLEGNTARFHFVLFRAARAGRHAWGRRFLEYCFAAPITRPGAPASDRLQCLIGLIPVHFAGAIEYAREMGGREMGLIPGACWMARRKRAVGGIQFLFLPKEGV